MKSGFRMTCARCLLAAPCLLALPGCDQDSASTLAEWTPADHDNQGTPTAGQVDTSKPRPGMPDLAKHGIDDVVLATWKQNCVRCHGLIGRGDGPEGRMLNPPDFTNPTWQKNAINSEIEYSIRKGKGQMPAFGHLPDETVSGLIKLVRMLNRDKQMAPADSDGADSDGSADSNGSAAPGP